MEDIQIEFNENNKALEQIFMVALSAPVHNELITEELRLDYLTLKRAIARARLYDIERFKKSEGAKKYSLTLTKKERTERARKAGSAPKNRTKTEHAL